MSLVLHGGLIARRWDGRWRGVLIEGPSGAGKSTVALRGASAGWRLAADDRVVVWGSGGRLYGRAPEPLAGLVEARGLGVRPAPTLPVAEIGLALSHHPEPERSPEPAVRRIAGVNIPALALDLRDPALLEKLMLTLQGDAGSQFGPPGA